jgi:hypothetical protein
MILLFPGPSIFTTFLDDIPIRNEMFTTLPLNLAVQRPGMTLFFRRSELRSSKAQDHFEWGGVIT